MEDKLGQIKEGEAETVNTGTAFTVTKVVAEQPPITYEIVVVPVAIPVNDPVPALIVPTAVFVLLQVPPDVGFANVLLSPTQALAEPVTGGNPHVMRILSSPTSVVPKSDVTENLMIAVDDVAVVLKALFVQEDAIAGGASIVVNVLPPSVET